MDKCSTCQVSFSVRNIPKNVIKCSFCVKYFHAECQKINDSVLKYICSGEQIIWNCMDCEHKRQFVLSFVNNFDELRNLCFGQQKVLEDLSNSVKKQGNTLNILRQEIKNSASSETGTPTVKRTFSTLLNGEKNILSPTKRPKKAINNVQRNTLKTKDIDSVIVIQHVNGENCAEQIEDKIRKHFDPNRDKMDSLKVNKNNKVVVRCRDESSYEKIKERISEVMGENFSVDKPKESNLVLLFRDVPEHWKEISDIQLLMCRNEELKKFVHDIKVTRISKQGTAYVECKDKETYKQLLDKKKLRIEWSVIRVQRYVDLRRCFKCQQYNHTAKECTNKPACAQFSGEHDVVNCDSAITCCINCVRAGSVNPRDHCAWSHKCPVLQKQSKRLS